MLEFILFCFVFLCFVFLFFCCCCCCCFVFWGGWGRGGGGGWRGKHGLLVDPLVPVRLFECFSQNIILYFLLKVGFLVMERERIRIQMKWNLVNNHMCTSPSP